MRKNKRRAIGTNICTAVLAALLKFGKPVMGLGPVHIWNVCTLTRAGARCAKGAAAKGHSLLQGVPTKQMAPDRVNPKGNGHLSRMASLRPACLAGSLDLPGMYQVALQFLWK